MVGRRDTCRIECVIRWRWVVDVRQDSFLIIDGAKKRHSGSAGRTLLCTSQAAYVTLYIVAYAIYWVLSRKQKLQRCDLLCVLSTCACIYVWLAHQKSIRMLVVLSNLCVDCTDLSSDNIEYSWQRWQVRAATRQRKPTLADRDTFLYER